MTLAPSFSRPFLVSPSTTTSSNQQLFYHSAFGEHRRRVTLFKQSGVIVTPKTGENAAVFLEEKKKKKKAVRFADELEHIRLFYKHQKPSAVGEGNPSVPYYYEVKLPNWPAKTVMRHQSLIRMESIQRVKEEDHPMIALQGRCRVANLAFEKHVTVRYTTDYWKSFEETEAIYREPIGSSANTWDRFTFLIRLDASSYSGITNITLYFCLHYSVNERDFWDNNDGLNYQIDIIPCEQHQQETPLKEDETISPPKLTKKKLLGHRYDFGASLSAAKKVNEVPSPPPSLAALFNESLRLCDKNTTDDQGHIRFSTSYHELVNKYCFYGNTLSSTSPTSPCPSPEPICS